MGIRLAVLGQRVLQELQVKAPHPCLGKLKGLGGQGHYSGGRHREALR